MRLGTAAFTLVEMIDITFDFGSDTPPGKDADTWSPTAGWRAIQARRLRSAPYYLHHRSELGEFWLSSDVAVPHFFWLAPIMDQKDFTGSPLPATGDAYRGYCQHAVQFISSRNQRIATYVAEHPPEPRPHGIRRASRRCSRMLKPSDNGRSWRSCSRQAIVSVFTLART
jgi:hypothetical protein